MAQGYTPVPVDDLGTELMLPNSTIRDLMAAAERGEVVRNQGGAGARLDYALNMVSNNAGTPFKALGNQPSQQQLLSEIKGWAAIAAGAKARRIRSLKLKVVEERMGPDGTEEQIPHGAPHPLAVMLKRPNHVFTTSQMLWILSWWLDQTGEGFWQIVTGSNGVPVELWPISPAQVKLVPHPTQIIAGYMVKDAEGKETALGLDEMIRFVDPDPGNIYGAMGSLGPQATEYNTGRYMSEHMEGHFKNDATPRVAIVGEAAAPKVSAIEQKNFYSKWKTNFNSRVGSAVGVPAFIPPGFSIQELSAHGGTSELVGLSDQNRDQVLSAYGVPGSMVGLVVDVNRAAAETNQYVFDANTIKPITDNISEALTTQLAMLYDVRLAIIFEQFVAGDKDFKLRQEDQDLARGVRTTQQVLRDREDGNPDDAPWGEFPIQPIAMVPYDGKGMLDDDGDDANDLRAERLENMRAAMRAEIEGGEWTSEQKAAASRIVDTSTEEARQQDVWIRAGIKYTGKFTKRMQRLLAAQQDSVAQQILLLPPSAFPTRSQTAQRSQWDDLAAQVFDPEQWDGPFEAAIEPLRTSSFTDAGSAAFNAVKTGSGKFALTESATAQLAARGADMRVKVNASTLRKVADVLEKGFAEGESVQQLAKRIEGASNIFGRKRARTIARTELLDSTQFGQTDGWRESGEVATSEWNISGINTRETHELMVAHDPVELGGYFTVGSGRAQHPGDSSLPAEERINCQCFLTPVLRPIEKEGKG